jgi:hypothetical protein
MQKLKEDSYFQLNINQSLKIIDCLQRKTEDVRDIAKLRKKKLYGFEGSLIDC